MKLFPVYPLFPINIVRGKGCRVWDEGGNEYLDLYGGHAVISIGHAHPHYVETVSKQVATIGFYSNSVENRLQEQLAERLGKACGYEDYQLFLINSGAEANENALKLASFSNGRTRVLSAEKAFHGRTSLAVEVTNNPKIIAPINDNGHVTYLPLNDTEAWVNEIDKGDVCACIIECIQGVGGIRMVEPAFYRAIREACTRTGTVLICDEIQCGYGRSGMFFAHQWLLGDGIAENGGRLTDEGTDDGMGVLGDGTAENGDTATATGDGVMDDGGVGDMRPDMVTVAKGIANGMPMGGVLIAPKFKAVYGQLGTTFGGNHLACAAALAVLDVIEDEHLIYNAREVGEYIMNRLREEQAAGNLPHVTDIRGRGLMIGIELDVPYKEIRQRLLFEHHVFTGCSGTNVLRLLPPLCLSKEEGERFVRILTLALSLEGEGTL